MGKQEAYERALGLLEQVGLKDKSQILSVQSFDEDASVIRYTVE